MSNVNTLDQVRATLNRIEEGVAIEKRNLARIEALEIENQRRFRDFLAETANRRALELRINSKE